MDSVKTKNICASKDTVKKVKRDFPGGPLVKTLPSNAGGVGSITNLGAKNPHALRLKNQNIKHKQYCNKFNKDFKNGPHQKNLKKKKKEESEKTTHRMGENFGKSYIRKGFISTICKEFR